MKHRNAFILAVIGMIICLFCLEGWGAEWRLYATTSEGQGFYEAEGITRQPNGIVRIWIKLIFTEKGKKDYVADMGEGVKDVSHTIMLEELDCDGKKSRVLQVSPYSKEKVLYTASSEKRSWTHIIPDTVAQALFNAVCREPNK